jgi:Ni/Co efflux regulator RcnB
MKRFVQMTAATGLALSLAFGNVAIAQQDQHTQANGPQHQMAPRKPEGERAPQSPHMAQNREAQHVAPPRQHVTNEHMTINHTTVIHQQTVVAGRRWHNGDRFDGNRRVVNNWSYYHAAPPPPGYEWVQDGNQLVLISIASGIIASVLANALAQ